MFDLMPALYPFTAIVGQAELKHALLLLAVNPKIGGVLVRGEKGTAKSTIVRALSQLLHGPMRTLALGASEENVIGGLDLEQTLKAGQPALTPGLLAEADRGIVYVDEINLLDDHLANLVLDAAASGTIRLEREGISAEFPSDFALVGTMNPEEGQLGPQLSDRFGLCVDVSGEENLTDRVEIIRRRLDFDANPDQFAKKYDAQQEALQERLTAARAATVRIPPSVRDLAAELSAEALSAGHRADLSITLAAQANAALDGRSIATVADVEAVAELALRHRRRQLANTPPPTPPTPPPPTNPPDHDNEAGDVGQAAADQLMEIGDTFSVRSLTAALDRVPRAGRGRRAHSLSADQRGHVIGWRPTDRANDLALAATLRAAAPHQITRRQRTADDDDHADLALLIEPSDWQRRVRIRKTSSLVVLVVDASGSMGARNRMAASKGAVLSLLLDAYVKRDKVALISFRKEAAEVLVPPTSSIELARDRLRELPTGGRTPLAAGLVTAHATVRAELAKDPSARPLVIVITDGRGNVNLAGDVSRDATAEAWQVAAKVSADPRIRWVVVDADNAGQLAGHSQHLATALQAQFFAIDQLRADELVRVVNAARLEESS